MKLSLDHSDKEQGMSELRTKIEKLMNSGKGTDYVIASLMASGDSSSEMPDMMVHELISLVCILEKEKKELEENNNDLVALEQVTASYASLYGMQKEKTDKDILKRIRSWFARVTEKRIHVADENRHGTHRGNI